MKKLLLILLISLSFCAVSETNVVFINVGHGDSILVLNNDKTYLFDTGKTERFGAVKTILDKYEIACLDGVFITHLDRDHTGGLYNLLDSGIEVKNIYFGKYYAEKDKKHPVNKLNINNAVWLQAGDTVDNCFTVLGPLYKNEDEENDNSLVIMFENTDTKLLLAGDMEEVELYSLLDNGISLSCDILKVPNHGDDDIGAYALLKNATPDICVVSASTEEDADTPSPEMYASALSYDCELLITEDFELGLELNLDKGNTKKSAIPYPTQSNKSLLITYYDNKTDTITLYNASSNAVSLFGYNIFSEKGNECLYISDDITIGAYSYLTVGTYSSPQKYDILWPEENVVSKKDEEEFKLYDNCGRLVASLRK